MKILSAAETAIISTHDYALVDFFAEWCGPCKVLAPELEKASGQINDLGVAVYKVNVDDCADFSIKNKISYVPTVIFFEKGVEKDRFVGALTSDKILDFVKKNK